MKIGVILAAYNCSEFIDDCLEPWLKLRETHEIIIAATSGRFSTYRDLGIPDKNEETLRKLATKGLDFLMSTGGDNLLEEDASRDRCLDYLKPHNCDVIWLLDGDEIYTEGQILGIIDFMERNPDKEGFSIWLKNFTIEHPYFISPWSRPTIYRNRLYGGIGRFYFDSFFEFADGIHGINDIEVVQIPKYVAFIDHYPWTDRGATRDKIKYQNTRYTHYNGTLLPEGSRCQYECDEGGIFFSNIFHQTRSIDIPSIHSYPTEILLSNIRIEYFRAENRFELESDYEMSGYNVIVNDIDNTRSYGSFNLSVSPGTRFWFVPSVPEEYLRSENFRGYRIEIERAGHILHIENVHTNIGVR